MWWDKRNHLGSENFRKDERTTELSPGGTPTFKGWGAGEQPVQASEKEKPKRVKKIQKVQKPGK